MGKDNKLKFYCMKEAPMSDYIGEALGDSDKSIEKLFKELNDKKRKAKIDEICEYLSKFLSKKEVDKMRKTAESLSDEEFNELVEKAQKMVDMMSDSFGK